MKFKLTVSFKEEEKPFFWDDHWNEIDILH